MSRMLWSCEVKLTGVNGQSGCIHLHADNLVTISEISQFLQKATTMAATLQEQHFAEMAPSVGWQPKIVNN
jgi:hypothetical protein